MINYPVRVGGTLACDEQANRVSAAGSVGDIVEPFTISVVVENNQAAPDKGALVVSCAAGVDTFEAPGGTQSGAMAKVTPSGVHQWAAVSNLRNMVNGGATASVAVRVGVNTKASKEQASSKVKMAVSWKGGRMETPDFWLNSFAEPFYLGDILVDLQSRTLSLDTSRVVSLAEGEVCKKPGGDDPNPPPDDPIDDPMSVTIAAPYTWCEGGYTEAAAPAVGDYIWPGEGLTVTRLETETIEAAKGKASLGKVAAVDSRKWVSTQYPDWASGKRFWRDADKDEPGSYDTHELHWLRTSTRNTVNNNGTPWGEELWVEQTRESGNGKTGRVFARVSGNRYPTLTEAMEYDIDQAEVVAENLEYNYHETSRSEELEWYEQKLPGLLSLYHFTNGKVITSVPCKCIGPRDFGDSLGVWYKHESQPLTNYPKTHTVWAQVGSRSDYGRVFVDHEPNLTWNEDLGIGEEVGAFYDVWSPLTEWINYRDKMWLLAGGSGFLFTVKYYYAWTLSPCHRTGVSTDQITVYTDPQTLPDDVANGSEVYVKYEYDYEGDGVSDEVSFWPEGQVTEAGSGVYSISSNRNVTFYINGKIDAGTAVAECTDCLVTQ